MCIAISKWAQLASFMRLAPSLSLLYMPSSLILSFHCVQLPVPLPLLCPVLISCELSVWHWITTDKNTPRSCLQGQWTTNFLVTYFVDIDRSHSFNVIAGSELKTFRQLRWACGYPDLWWYKRKDLPGSCFERHS